MNFGVQGFWYALAQNCCVSSDVLFRSSMSELFLSHLAGYIMCRNEQ